MNYTLEEKYTLAKQAYDNAYAPYSSFQVGAVLILKDGTTISGSNVENASYGLTNCAERSALFSAYSKGLRKDDILEIIIMANPTSGITSPCGACRQVISELMNQDAIVTMINLKKEVFTCTVKELIPFAFTSGDLHE